MKIKIADWNDFVKASRRGAREAEIELFGHPIDHRKIFKNRKKYSRKAKHPSQNEDI